MRTATEIDLVFAIIFLGVALLIAALITYHENRDPDPLLPKKDTSVQQRALDAGTKQNNTDDMKPFQDVIMRDVLEIYP